ncbi:glycosyltransferase 25 family member [Diachasmimorpha longicaudata]|uniref:glycosyltransferase 25 family member n=1 Tax=Diachasmimorpha longicaudata TaxID=58733 RepID=UPI0030B8C136
MWTLRSVTFLIIVLWAGDVCYCNLKRPTVLVAVLVRNKAHTLPYFLSLFGNLNYTKERISLWIRSDNNIDNSVEILTEWLNEEGKHYHSVNAKLNEESHGFNDEKGTADWSNDRFSHVISLRQEALNYARESWADYIFMLDADIFLTNPNTLNLLIDKEKSVVAPLLKSDGLYSNFWAGMTQDYYYERTDRYKPIVNRVEQGCHDVPMVHSAVLIDLGRKESDQLSYDPRIIENYAGPDDDIIAFALGANSSGISLYVCNDEIYGYVMVPLESGDSLEADLEQLTNLKLEILGYQLEIPLSPKLQKYTKYPRKDTLGMSHIFMINLERRTERRLRMERCFDELGIEAETLVAVDGRKLNETVLMDWGIKMMPQYADPYHKRPMKMGEIGCFLSHYIIWKRMIDDNYKQVMVLEDDVRFEPYFRNKINVVMGELKNLHLEWDLVYLGRKRMQEEDEPYVKGSKYLVHAGYSYWTLGYILSHTGAQKLLDSKPLNSLVPVDEYLPILFDKHPRANWKGYFPRRNLIALSTAPLLVYPTHYTGESGYISDTENSNIIAADKITVRKNEL